jgi:hypothetical protein
MTEQTTSGQKLAKGAGLLATHLFAVVAGVVLMVIGLGMGVSVVMLPVGVPVGLIGLFAFIWGLFGWSEEQAQPPGPH